MIIIDLGSFIPIYEQIKAGFRRNVGLGVLKPGDDLPSIRELAETLLVNPNTVARSYRELEMEGLIVALTKQTAAIRARHGIEVVLSLCDEPDVPLPVKEALYRINQEALQNAIKHARPERLDVRLELGEGDCRSLTLEPHGDAYRRIVERLSERTRDP